MSTPTDPERPGTPEGMTERDLDERAALAGHLGKEVWPATGAQLQALVDDPAVPDRVRSQVGRLPGDRTFATLAEVWEEVSGHRETHRF